MEKIGVWNKGDWVRLIKRAQKPDALAEAGCWETFQVGGGNSCSLPVDYELEGFLLAIPKVGSPLLIDRRIRNRVRAHGIFSSSLVVEIIGEKIITLNSHYEMAKVKVPKGMEPKMMTLFDAEGVE